ncbi:hypothetical protein ATKI12_0513 [Kitasatospora sp. Ki12]
MPPAGYVLGAVDPADPPDPPVSGRGAAPLRRPGRNGIVH